MKPTPQEMDYSAEKIAEMRTWLFFAGFTAASCGQCRKTANVPCGPGWSCPCGGFNMLPWSGSQIPHESPDYGPPRSRIVGESR